jgi:hypothetical protein
MSGISFMSDWWIDFQPAIDEPAVEHPAFLDPVLVDDVGDGGDVLHLAARVGETQIDIGDLLVLDPLYEIGSGAHGVFPSVLFVSSGWVFGG